MQAKACAYADRCTISMRVAPLSTLRQMTTSMNSPHQLATLKMHCSRRSSSSRLARAHERAGRGRAGRASKRGHRGHIMRSLVCSPRAQSFGSGCRVNCRGERSAPGANKTCLPEKT